jgi:hypothetical protein
MFILIPLLGVIFQQKTQFYKKKQFSSSNEYKNEASEYLEIKLKSVLFINFFGSRLSFGV